MIITRSNVELISVRPLGLQYKRIEVEVKEGGQLKWIGANLFSYYDLLSMRYRNTLHFS